MRAVLAGTDALSGRWSLTGSGVGYGPGSWVVG